MIIGFFLSIIVIIMFIIVLVLVSNLQGRVTSLQMQLMDLQKKVHHIDHNNNVNDVVTQTTQNTSVNLTEEIPIESVNEVELINEIPKPIVTESFVSQMTAKPEQITAATAEPIGNNSVIDSPFEAPKTQAQKTESPTEPDFGQRVITWLIKGNPVAKIAIIILFFGLSYLFKYSIDHGLLSPEVRILGSFVLGLALLTIGWRLRHKKELYALILQGGAIGVLYLTIFAAFKLDLVPLLLTLALLIVICATSILFAVLQRAMSLSIIASIGGYLAPILLSTGGGNHIALFSYYLLISSAILVISIWQSWRILNLLGFLFTFIVAIVWGMKNFQPEFYFECQIFILANMLIYGVLAVLLSIRSIKKEQYQYPIDLILLFGVPLSGFCLQYAISKQWEFGPAFSSLGFGLFYLIGAYITLRAWQTTAKSTSLFGLAIGLGFSTLAIPLAFTANWTALIWLFEGTALSWAMLTQKQYRFAWFGTLITLLGTLSALVALQIDYLATTQFITLFGILSAILLFNACLWHCYRDVHSTANVLKLLFAVVAGIAWTVWVLSSMARIVETMTLVQPIIFCFIISVWLWYFIGKKLKWDMLCYAVVALWPVLLLSLLSNGIFYQYTITSGLWGLIWIVAFVSAYYYLHTAKLLILQLHANLLIILHISLLWIIFGWLYREIAWLLSYIPWGFAVVKWSICTASASLIMLLLYLLTKRNVITSANLLKAYWLIGLSPVGLYLLCQLLIGLSSSGQILFWHYIPIINPLEESAIFALMMLGVWLKLGIGHLDQNAKLASKSVPLPIAVLVPLIILSFLWSNSMVLRLLSQLFDLSWSFYVLWHTNIVQVVLSLIWTITSVILVMIAHRYLLRKVWYAGAILQGIVVAKLVFVDSVELDGLLRAFVFIGVALLMLLIGYLAPLPPKMQTAAETTN